ncbi:hypothetical protein PENSUB_5217 [Penicillium subrubescens]|uniref:DUF3533 domain-containing protein n=1 Tax=Penicillium subrubescens TaxID=1316194 RepID=A0A1Q5UAA3_9EURO|nr:hypothetical protein PENSUB_5217 [Penicillium subrubescens]
MNVLFGDYDQGIIGEVNLKDFPTVYQHSITEYPTADDVRQAVCKSHFWGAIYANTGASSRLSSALVSPRGAEVYNNSQALTYVLNGAKYAAYAQTIYSSLEVLMQATKRAYSQINGAKVMAAINVTNSRIA